MKKITLTLFCILSFTKLFPQVNLQLLGHLSYSTTCAGVWQYADSLGNEYALVGAGDGISIVDVTTPSSPALLFTVQAASSLWRELKTSGHYCYAVTEGGGGVTILNLQYLPDSVPYKVYTGDGAITGQVNSAHTVAVTDGYMYIFGSNIGVGGAIICDVTTDPWNPVYTGQYNLHYIHDGYIRNDTLWAGEIYAGQFSVIDVTNKSNPVLITTQQTPGQFCHNTWLSDNGKYLFTTDEVGGAPLGSFDVSDLGNITLEGIYFTDTMPNEEVHNVRVINDYLINPSYGSQLTIADAARPGNVIEIASYPTGSFLCWDASPYLPSGNIIATDVGGGLYIFAPYYVRACYLEGTVTDSITGIPLNNVSVKILSTVKQTLTDITGYYKTGILDSGYYDVEFSKPGYITKTITGVALNNGVLTLLDVQLVSFIFSGQVVETSTGNPIQNAKVRVKVSSAVIDLLTDISGNFSTSAVISGNGEVIAAKWGYQTECVNTAIPASVPLVIQLPDGIYDDFTFDFGWTVTGNAVNGMWVRDEPVGTIYVGSYLNPDSDVVDDCSVECFVTGNGGGNFNNDDVDDGFTQLASPVFDLSSYTNPYLNYERWFKELGSNPNNADTLFIRLSNGTSNALMEQVLYSTAGSGTWVNSNFEISNYIAPTSTMQLTVFIEDKPATTNPLECAFDKFFVSEGPLGVNELIDRNEISVFPNPFVNKLKINNAGPGIRQVEVCDLTGRKIVAEYLNDEKSNSITLDLSALQTGIYILNVKTADGSFTAKIVKM